MPGLHGRNKMRILLQPRVTRQESCPLNILWLLPHIMFNLQAVTSHKSAAKDTPPSLSERVLKPRTVPQAWWQQAAIGTELGSDLIGERCQ